MKIDFIYTGDVHDFVMTMLRLARFTLTNKEQKTLLVEPRFKEENFQISLTGHPAVALKTMTIPVKILDYGSDAVMTFKYTVKQRQLPTKEGQDGPLVEFFEKDASENREGVLITFK